MKILAADMTASQKKRIFMGMLSLFMFFGVAFGTILVIKDRDMSWVAKAVFHQNLVKSNEEQNVFRIFAGSFLPVAVMLVFQLLCGFFCIRAAAFSFNSFFQGNGWRNICIAYISVVWHKGICHNSYNSSASYDFGFVHTGFGSKGICEAFKYGCILYCWKKRRGL